MKAELKKNSVNQIIKGTDIFEEGDEVTEVGLVIKGRVRVHTEGVNLVVGSGNFLGLCDLTDKTHQVKPTMLHTQQRLIRQSILFHLLHLMRLLSH